MASAEWTKINKRITEVGYPKAAPRLALAAHGREAAAGPAASAWGPHGLAVARWPQGSGQRLLAARPCGLIGRKLAASKLALRPD